MTDDRDALALYQQTFDGVPLYNGFSGYCAPDQYAMRELLIANDPRILQALASRGSLAVVIDHEADDKGLIPQVRGRLPGAQLHETRPTWSSYTLPASSAGDLLPDRIGDRCASSRWTPFRALPIRRGPSTAISGHGGAAACSAPRRISRSSSSRPAASVRWSPCSASS